MVKREDSQLSGCGFKPRRCILDGVSEARYYIGKREIKVSKWGTPKKIFKKTYGGGGSKMVQKYNKFYLNDPLEKKVFWSEFLVCPDGFEMLDNERCVTRVSVLGLRVSADKSSCNGTNPSSQLVQPKTVFGQMSLQNFGIEKKFLEENIFLGMAKTAGVWYWNNGQQAVQASSKLG